MIVLFLISTALPMWTLSPMHEYGLMKQLGPMTQFSQINTGPWM
jgi:hypothetical protein